MMNVIREVRSYYYKRLVPTYVVESIKIVDRFHPMSERAFLRDWAQKFMKVTGKSDDSEMILSVRQHTKMVLLRVLEGKWWMQ